MPTTPNSKLSWGILGTGNIAGQFAHGVNRSDRSSLAAVGSRTLASAQSFAASHKISAAHASYDALLADPAVRAVYISLPNSVHHEWTLKCLAAGKHVLCEKPFAINLAQAQEMIDAANRAQLILAEAFMYRSHPLTHAVQNAVASGVIGRLKIIRTAFIYHNAAPANNVRFSVPLAGGSLMDIGCYCISYSRLFASAEPTALTAYGHLHETGVDDYAAGALAFPNDIVAHFACGMTVHADNTATLLGDAGYLEIPIPWKPPEKNAEYTLVDSTGKRHTTKISAKKALYALEADDFAATVLDGAPQRVTHADTLGNQKCLDTLRHQIGLPY